jgi:predicted Rossmann fold nucleotide-binding protein DprA/Smf involved in DNA uptake
VNYALDCGKDVYCLPFNCDQEEGAGNNFLIQQGANILTNPLELTKL